MKRLHGPVKGVGVLSSEVSLAEDGLFLRLDVGNGVEDGLIYLDRKMARELANALIAWGDAP